MKSYIAQSISIKKLKLHNIKQHAGTESTSLDKMIEKSVGIGEVRVDQGDVILAAYGVGSCVVIVLYDAVFKIGGLAHVMLPLGNDTSSRYPKGALKKMLQHMSTRGVSQRDITAKIVGGASMFDIFKRHGIGKQNVERTRKELRTLGIPIVAEDVFGHWGRSVFFNLANGEVLVRSCKCGDNIL